ncbi:hypothetical protein [Nocardia aurantia]|uniref:Uncharacterized protein n=1 Tax=Nocardia aurantia TaxID=2585199 RepID=A0A7K0E247_9NOCA|nr:hypothetical protein [Nocardia aurantia]MQY31847.1 hypothetical protein [Nocardia aurantia]
MLRTTYTEDRSRVRLLATLAPRTRDGGVGYGPRSMRLGDGLIELFG